MATPLSSPIVRDGDTAFLGLQSRRNPLTIKEGYLQVAQNIRLDRGIAQTRKGAKRLAAGISVGAIPVTLDFVLHGGDAVTSITQSGNVATVTTAAPHALGAIGSQYLVEIAGVTGATASAYNGKFTVRVTGASTFTYNVSGSPASNPPGTITWAWPVLQSTYAGGIFGAGVYSSPRYDYANEYIVLCGPTAAYLYRQGSTLLTLSYPLSPITEQILPGDIVSTLQAFDRIFLFRWRPSDQQQKVTSISQASGTVTVTTPVSHGYSVGEVIRLSGSDQSAFNLDAVITSVPTSVTFQVSILTSPSANTSTSLFAQRVQCPLVWDGVSSGFVRVPTGSSPLGPTYSRMVSPTNGIACYYNNQVVLCNGRDTLLISDVLDPDNYDPMLKGFRTNVGSNDYLVAVHPYADRQIIAFLRKSIYLGTLVLASDGVSVDTVNSSLELLTTEVGCAARLTVATAGNYIYFLADQGIYRLDNSQIDLALRGNSLPLSEPVADIFATITQSAISTANAVYFNNRYYLAVPTNGAASPNTLIIYNQLNEAWESVDTNLPSFDRLVVSDYGNQRRLFAASNLGSIYLLEEYDTSSDDASTGSAGVAYNGVITTRRYFYGQLSRKRLGNIAVSAYLPSGSTVDVAAVTTDPDNTTHVATVTNNLDNNDYTVRAPIRRPGTYLDLTITTSGGRPTIRAVSADATLPSDTSRLARTES